MLKNELEEDSFQEQVARRQFSGASSELIGYCIDG